MVERPSTESISMFQIHENDSVDIDSSWKTEKVFQDSSQQTTEFSVKHQNTMTHKYNSVQIQTDNPKNKELKVDVDMNKLADWLKKIYPEMKSELNEPSLSNVFAANDYDERQDTPLAKILQNIIITNKENAVEYVSCMAWNSTGNTLAASYCCDHDNWCCHEGKIRIFTFDREDKLVEQANKKITCSSCVTSISFHPSKPSTLGVGLYSGEIQLRDVQNDDSVDGLLETVSGHDDKVTKLLWLTGTEWKHGPLLVSASLDACVVLWNLSTAGLQVKNRYKMTMSSSTSKKCERGVLDLDFSVETNGLFVVGTEGGCVLKCSTLGTNVSDPLVSSYRSHNGQITNVQFSPHRRELFLSAASDGEIRIYHVQQVCPVQIIFVKSSSTSAVAWVRQEEHLLVTCSGVDGSVRLYSLRHGQHIPNVSLSTHATPLSALALNNNRKNTMVVGDTDGNLQLWNIPWNDIALQDRYSTSTHPIK